ncbi:ubiquitin-protein ligase SAN1 [Saccharomyces paradoxus]|uniref:Ubiquitin-protein ligase SAN1 n=1 Tax=Saccharomyces paradoxus TaxID=27291 RepID=A0A8B8UNM8_SACPA|nr:San1 [Saccharomyces paradoxus]QHS72353.1 San1 [Saccharomyces paradoxus]
MSESDQGQDRGTNTSPNNIENNNNSNSASAQLNSGTEQTRNITVSIQYSYFTPERLAHLSNISNNGNTENNSATSASTIAPGTGPSFGIGNGGHQPDGALVLSFRDVPASTPQDRLNSFISVAAQLAMERFNRLLNRPKGITKDEFDKLPVLPVSDLPKTEGPLCSICYDEYEDESDPSKTKRKRDSEDEGESEGTKKRKDNEGALNTRIIAGNGSGPSITNAAVVEQPPDLHDEETNPSYKHSPIKLPCGHIFGRECIYKWSRLENSCPLCRQKISESAGVQRAAQQDTDEVAANEAAFERIRRVLYDPTAANNTNENATASENTSNTTVPTIGNANSGEQMLSRTGFFLMPQNGQSLHDPVRLPPNDSDRNVFSGLNSTDQNLPSNPGGSNNNQSPRWVPIPLTLFQFHSPNPNSNASNSSASPSTTTGSNSNDTSSDATDAHHNRLRAVLDHIFNVAQGGTSDTSETETSGAQTVQNQGHNDTSSFDATQGSSFLDNISRLTGHFRNGSRENNNDNNYNNDHQGNGSTTDSNRNNLFSSGVASYRNQNGDVTTVELNSNNSAHPPADENSSQDQDSSSSDTTIHNNVPNDNNEQRSTQ